MLNINYNLEQYNKKFLLTIIISPYLISNLYKIFYSLNITIIILNSSDKVQHYRGLNKNLDKLYGSIKWEIEVQKDLEIVSEYEGTMNSVPLRSIVAVNKSPKV